MATKVKTATVCVVGAGYVGFPLSRALSRSYQVISFAVDDEKIRRLLRQNGNPNHIFTTDPSLIAELIISQSVFPRPSLRASGRICRISEMLLQSSGAI
jgi:UDP-N-acetyl-D-mannosaminuronate dehydrogenase